MKILRLGLKNYRNCENIELNFKSRKTLIIGKNAQGKTNILESVYFLSDLKSPRTSTTSDLIQIGKNGFEINATIEKNNTDIELDYCCNQDKKREIKVNKVKTTPKNFKTVVKTVLFSTKDLLLLRGAPQDRREWLDRAISQVYPAYDERLSKYDKIRIQKNNLLKNEIIDIFHRLGFSIADGPEIEDDLHVFTAMNFAEDHPARDMQDTFFIEANQEDVKKNIVLRTHTSSVQARAMEHSQPPIRIICPGRVYRNEAISYRAHAFFHQVEALYIDKNVSFTDLKQVLLLFAKEMFGEDTQIRLRPSYFPFTEPSAEMDISCNICGGKGCPFCKGTGWVEILGCGMVDPNVLEANGIDSKVYSGYALGMGIERITNLKYRVNDLRLFSENDTRFLKEFEAAN